MEIRGFILLLLTVTAFAPKGVAQSTLGSFAERQALQLERRKALVAEQLISAQEANIATPCDSLERVIFELEQQVVAIDKAIVRIAQKLKEETSVAEQPTPVSADTLATATPQEIAVEELKEEPKEVVTEEIVEDSTSNVTDSLRTLFTTTSRRYDVIEKEIAALFDTYSLEYNKAKTSSSAYDEATNVKSTEEHYSIYTESIAEMASLADDIADRSDRLVNSKMGAFFAIADALGLGTLREKYATLVDETEDTLGPKLESTGGDIDLAMYPHRLKCTILLEQEIAALLMPERSEELATKLESYDTSYAIFPEIKGPKRAKMNFKGVEIVKNQRDKAVSSLPKINAPSQGELYSIMVANYANLPPSTAPFRDATPLYRETRGDGRTYIYIGLYPTAESAKDDIALLREVGFKQPTLVMWLNGIRRDDYGASSSVSTNKKSTRFRIEIHGVSAALSSEALSAIRENAPRKEISKFNDSDNNPIYTVGTFSKESEAKSIAEAIATADSTITTRVVEFGK